MLGIYHRPLWVYNILFSVGSVLLVSDEDGQCEGLKSAGQVTITGPALFLYVPTRNKLWLIGKT